MTASPDSAAPSKPTFLEAAAVYLKPRVLIVLFLGFSSGLPLALSGSTLLFWAAEVGVNLKTIGLFALVGTPYTIKFLWAPIVDALDVPILARLLGRRRGWLLLTQILLMAAIMFLGVKRSGFVARRRRPRRADGRHGLGDTGHRGRRLPHREPATRTSRPPAWRRTSRPIASACWPRARARFTVVSGFQALGFTKSGAWSAGYVAMAVLVVVGMLTTLIATEPEKSRSGRSGPRARDAARAAQAHRLRRLRRFLQHDGVVSLVVLVFVVLFKFTDALAGVMTGPFAVELGFSRTDYANDRQGRRPDRAARRRIRRRLHRARAAAGGEPVDRRHPAVARQSCLLLARGGGHDLLWLTVAITVENFTSAIGTVMFVAYLSALCRNPLHTATQYALLTALAAVGRTYLSAGAGYHRRRRRAGRGSS